MATARQRAGLWQRHFLSCRRALAYPALWQGWDGVHISHCSSTAQPELLSPMWFRKFWTLLIAAGPRASSLQRPGVVFASARAQRESSVPSASCLILLSSQTQTSSPAQTCSGRNPTHKKIPPRQVSPHCSFCWLEKWICCCYRIPDELQKESQLWQFAIFVSKGQGMWCWLLNSCPCRNLDPWFKIRNWCAEHVGFVGTHRCCC